MEQRDSIRRIVLRQFFGFMLVMLILLSITIYTAQEYVIFFPNKDDAATITLAKSNQYERIQITDTYSGWLKEEKNSDAVIVYFGGNAQNTSSTFLTFQENGTFSLLENISFLSIDYPSYGDSIGSLSQDSLFTMADDVMSYVTKRFANQQIVIIGYSIGTGVASYAASRYEPDAFILITPYNNGKDLFNSYVPIFYGPLQQLIQYPLTSDVYVSSLSCPSLVLMVKGDSIVSAKLARKLINAFPVEPESKVYENTDHGSIILDTALWEDIVSFLNRQIKS